MSVESPSDVRPLRGPALLEALRRFEGAVLVGAPARDPVNQPMIRHWCDAVRDANPNYTDPAFAAAGPHAGVVAPPTMLQAWIMPGYVERRMGDSPLSGLFALLDAAGFTSVVATNCEQEYPRYLHLGDVLSCEIRIERISEEKRTALGPGHFIDELYTYRDAAGEVVGIQRWRMLKFAPERAEAAAPRPSPPRPRPGMTDDTRFFWEGARAGRLLIQRCADCGTLRHPPGPMCPRCQSLAWDTQEASGRGHVYSYVVAHHPPVPPFEYPHPIALVELEEGTRLVSNLVGVAPADVRIGMPVRVEFLAVDEGLSLPQFRPLDAAAGEAEA